MNYTVKNKLTLNRLQYDKTLKREIRSITIEMDSSSDDVKSYKRKINRYYFACGCTMGKITVSCTLLVFGILWLINKESDLLIWWKIVVGVFVSALIGKIIGLVISHYLLQRTYSKLGKLFA
jgi:hypothetical protein